MTALADVKLLTLDTETTGINPALHSPCEVGWVLTSLTANLVNGSTLVNPGRLITNEAKAIHHILDEDVAQEPALMQALKERMVPAMVNFPIDAYVAHNAAFDGAMLPMLNKKPWLCTYRLAKKLYPELPHHSNQFLRYELGLEVPEAKGLPAHRALADAFVTAALVRHLLGKMLANGPNLTLEDVIAYSLEPSLIHMCQFNKHKDRTWEDVVKFDADYCQWVLGPDFKGLDEDTRYTLEHWRKILWPQGWPKKSWRR